MVRSPKGQLGSRALLARRIRATVARLEKAYGPRRWQPGDGPVEELVATILSQNTNDANSRAAYEELTRCFRDWRDVTDAPARRVADAIRSGGLADQKTATIQRALRQIRDDFGEITLDVLAKWPPQRSMDYLTSIRGIGPKTAACVLLFSLGQPVLPVDTHIHRQAIRLGLVSPNASAVQTQQALQVACPPKLVYAFHVLLITHGRRICHAQRPNCPACVLADLCIEYPSRQRRSASAAPIPRRDVRPTARLGALM
jgi:endonuclease III